MTVQTEIIGDPNELVTFVDFRGRVLKRWTTPLLPTGNDAVRAATIRSWHSRWETHVRKSLAQAARQRTPALDLGEATSRMFLAGMRAYAKRDFETAKVALEACARLLPGDARVRCALLRMSL